MTTTWTPLENHPKCFMTRNKRVLNSRNQEALRYVNNRDASVDPLPPLIDEWTTLSCGKIEVSRDLKFRNKSSGEEVSFHVRIRKIRVDLDFLYEQTFCETPAFTEEAKELTRLYPQYDFSKIFTVSPLERSRLMCIVHPEFIPFWADNPELLPLISRSSGELCKWNCFDHDKEYDQTVHAKDRGQHGCKSCLPPSEAYREFCRNAIETGADSEAWIAEHLQQHPAIGYAKAVGDESNSIDDIEAALTVDGIVRAVQIKHMTKKKDNEAYHFLMKPYPPQMLIVSVNSARDRFLVAFAKDLTKRDVDLTFTSRARTHNDKKFKSWESAVARIVELLPQTIATDELVNRYSPSNLLEKEMIGRLKSACEGRGFSFRSPPNNGTVIDRFINNKPVQLKFTTVKSYQCYVARIVAGNGQRVKCPYSATDPIDFLIIEVDGFKGKFCILPKHFMVSEGYFSTPKTAESPGTPGRETINIRPPTDPGKFEPYWDNFNLLS